MYVVVVRFGFVVWVVVYGFGDVLDVVILFVVDDV